MATLDVRDLTIRFDTEGDPVHAVHRASFTVEPGQVLGIVGESGSGKSASVRAVLGLLPRNAVVTGSIRFNGRELLGLTDRELRRIRGREIGLIFQDPMTSLNPVRSIEAQLSEALTIHERVAGGELRRRVVACLAEVGFPDAERRLGAYPFELSGGLRQRVMIAMAIINRPSLIIADEPTSALDATTQVQILELLSRLTRDLGAAAILITHDLGVAAHACGSVLVMYAGRIVERGPVQELFGRPEHPYSWGLLRSMPAMQVGGRLTPIPGVPPHLDQTPIGCVFAPRCQFRIEACATDDPADRTEQDQPEHSFACHLDTAARHAESRLVVNAMTAIAKASTPRSEGPSRP
jgi:oligopeptide/dipeptide ABC transporter ATP-binding protein